MNGFVFQLRRGLLCKFGGGGLEHDGLHCEIQTGWKTPGRQYSHPPLLETLKFLNALNTFVMDARLHQAMSIEAISTSAHFAILSKQNGHVFIPIFPYLCKKALSVAKLVDETAVTMARTAQPHNSFFGNYVTLLARLKLVLLLPTLLLVRDAFQFEHTHNSIAQGVTTNFFRRNLVSNKRKVVFWCEDAQISLHQHLQIPQEKNGRQR
jgi:hypothetical protein